MSSAITYLFVPAHEARKVERALASDADAVILDLEDSVPTKEEAYARTCAANVISTRRSARPELWVRLNADKAFGPDVAAVDWRQATGAVLPKAERPDQVGALCQAGVQRAVLLIESVTGLSALRSLPEAAPIVERIALGTWDLAADLGLHSVNDPDESELIWQLRGLTVLESRRLRLQAPIDGVWVRLGDASGLRDVCVRSSRLGFGGKLVIHPQQLPVVRAAFVADETTLAQARAIVRVYKEAQREGRGVIQLDGRMIDRAVVQRAELLLERARRQRA